MRRLFYVVAVIVVCAATTLVPGARHSAKVMGSLDLGNQQVTTFLDEVTGCIHKSSPHQLNLFASGEAVELELRNGGNQMEVIKSGLTERVFAHPKCRDDGGIGPVLRPKITTGRQKRYPEEPCSCSRCNCGPCGAICIKLFAIGANPDPNETYVDIEMQMVEGRLRFRFNEADAIPPENAIELEQDRPLSPKLSGALGGYNMVILKKGSYVLDPDGQTYIDVKLQP